ncbi:MAG: SDR family oxidoreductase [Trichodesmium sp. St18_bin1]|nr:SDR family oxidoreductase [Trichodesmium sp. St18_bin1]
MDLGLKGQVALVTASSRGIGKAIAEGLAQEGCQVIISSRDQDNLLKTAQEIGAKTGQLITPIPVDLEQKYSISQFLKAIINQFSSIDILVNNAGGMPYKRHYELHQEDWQQSFDLTFMSQVNIAEALLPLMKKQSWGRIIFVTSVAAKQPGMMIAHSQRASVVAYAKTLANELGEYNILVNSICPSFAVTDKFYEVADEVARRQGSCREEVIQQWMKSVPLRRPGTAEEVANLAVFLASEKASYITGTCIQVDGGFVKSLF